MASVLAPLALDAPLPDHSQLPDKDGVPVRNSLEPWQSSLLSESLEPILRARYPDGDYFIGQDCGIYWSKTSPPSLGCKAPDWYLVVGVPRLLDDQMRRSYVLWQEMIVPLIILEYASGSGEEERDNTAMKGKFWVYERRIRPPYYGIYLPDEERIEMYHMVEDRFEIMPPNARGRFGIKSLKVELGIWKGEYAAYQMPWMRWWNEAGALLPAAKERADQLAAKLRALGVNPDDA